MWSRHADVTNFAWSNERQNPTMCKLDSFFCDTDWGVQFVTRLACTILLTLRPLPLLLEDAVGPRRLRTFKFENIWVSLPGFSEVVSNAWSEPSGHSQPFQALHYKLKKVGTPPLRVEPKAVVQRQNPSPVALWIILHLDIAQEQRPLSLAEVDLRSRLKRRVIFLAVLECAWK